MKNWSKPRLRHDDMSSFILNNTIELLVICNYYISLVRKRCRYTKNTSNAESSTNRDSDTHFGRAQVNDRIIGGVDARDHVSSRVNINVPRKDKDFVVLLRFKKLIFTAFN